MRQVGRMSHHEGNKCILSCSVSQHTLTLEFLLLWDSEY
jgi:hypothetical protein